MDKGAGTYELGRRATILTEKGLDKTCTHWKSNGNALECLKLKIEILTGGETNPEPTLSAAPMSIYVLRD